MLEVYIHTRIFYENQRGAAALGRCEMGITFTVPIDRDRLSMGRSLDHAALDVHFRDQTAASVQGYQCLQGHRASKH